MRLVRVESLKPGFVVGRALLDEKGKVLLNAGVELSERYIQVLETKGISSIFIQDLVEIELPLPDEDLDPAVRAAAIEVLDRAFTDIEDELPEIRAKSIEEAKKVLDSQPIKALASEDGPLADIRQVVESILNDVLDRATLAGLTTIKSESDRLLNHSVDVCVVGLMIGKAVGISQDQLRQLATGSLLHDIGKLFIDKRASELSQVRQHTLLGYELLRSNESMLSPHVAYEHHEHQDGSGQPRGLVGSNTIKRDRSLRPPVPTLIGEIAAIANLYDNLLSGSESRPPMTPETVLQTMDTVAGSKINSAVYRAFRKVVPVYPLGTEVLIRGNKFHNFRAIVSRIHADNLDRPVIVIIRDNKGESVAAEELNLLEELELKVRAVGIG